MVKTESTQPSKPRRLRTARRAAAVYDVDHQRSTVSPSPKSTNDDPIQQDRDLPQTEEEEALVAMAKPKKKTKVDARSKIQKPSLKTTGNSMEKKKGDINSKKRAPTNDLEPNNVDATVSTVSTSKRVKKNTESASKELSTTAVKKLVSIAATLKKIKHPPRNAANTTKTIHNTNEDVVVCVPCKPVATAAKRAAAAAIDSSSDDNASDVDTAENESEDNAETQSIASAKDDRPFMVEYSTSSRSTCRRCDATIEKGALRISHVPLFRGKPGYRVYRHLACAVFSEDIHMAQDIGGWKDLSLPDLMLLEARVKESQLEVEMENEDLDPDELVQKAFEGEIRGTPPGFVGTHLPFQVEGQSWMYHQEVHKPEIRGGILADEMGMV
jgi:hypothetical protein